MRSTPGSSLQSIGEYADTNAQLREAHLQRRVALGVQLPACSLGPPAERLTCVQVSTVQPRPSRRKYVPPSSRQPDEPVAQAPQVPVPYDSLFKMYQQQGIREYRMTYNRRVNEALQPQPNLTGRANQQPFGAAGPIGSLAIANADRHTRPLLKSAAMEAATTRQLNARYGASSSQLPVVSQRMPATDRLLRRALQDQKAA
mmetsp:Transcript_5879/g.12877  ORF Transcript_5879/g.12877 Transcript_5879/m.12877 type:complete len:201 (+) Transcript_5879:326-928(+)|eukprot:633711-Pleurochrysis_carterae.AAC.2